MSRIEGAIVIMLKSKHSDKNYLYQIADDLDRAGRLGNDKDKPEGTRYIQISDTLAGEIAERLRKIAYNINESIWQNKQQKV